jgi:transcription elongation factor Elf1
MSRRGMTRFRQKPYTEVGIKRGKCCRCGSPAAHQWGITLCAIKRGFQIWVLLCVECDVAHNVDCLRFFNIPNSEKLIERYKEEQLCNANQ